MSDCSTNANGPYDVARLRIEFDGEEIPWMYPLALNGRVIKGVFVDNERYERVRGCEFAPDGMMDGKVWFACSDCGGYVTADYAPPRFCPHCGARVVSA